MNIKDLFRNAFYFEGKFYSIVVLENVLEKLEDDFVRTYFMNLCALKVKGYGQKFKQYIPVSSHDFCANHLTIAEISDEKIIPVFAFESITLACCQKYSLKFPVFTLFEEHSNLPHASACKELLEANQFEAGKLAYNGGFTIQPELRRDRLKTSLFWEIGVLMLMRYYQDYNISSVICGVNMNIKVIEKWKTFLGYKPMGLRNEVLEEFPYHAYGNAMIRLMLLEGGPPLEAQRSMESLEHYWTNRVTINDRFLQETQSKEAA